MANNTRSLATPVAAALLAGSAVAAGAWLAWRAFGLRRTAPDPIDLTPGYRGGAGTPLLLLHGVGAIWRAWSPVLPYLEPHHDVIVPTLRGHGGAAPLGADVTPSVDALADSIEDELDALGLSTVHIAGNSLGGWLGIELARRGRARSLVLFSPAGAWRSQRSIELRANAIRLSVGTLGWCANWADLIAANPILRWPLLAPQVAYPNRVAAEELAAYIRAGSEAPVVLPLLRVLPQQQVQPLPADHEYPVRLVWADRDRVLPFDGFGAAMLERLPRAELIRLPGVGHVPMSDEPARVAELILEVTTASDSAAPMSSETA